MAKNSKGTINFFVEYNSIFSLGPWRNSIQLLSEEGYEINVFQFADKRINENRSKLEDNYTLYQIKYFKVFRYLLGAIKLFFRSFNRIGLKKLSTLGDGIDYLFRTNYFVMGCILKNKCENNEIFIAGDPPGIIAARYLSKKKKGHLIYWSLELYLEKELNNFGLKLIKKFERKYNKEAKATIDFGEQRCRILCEENNLDPNTMISIPNSPIGPGKIERKYYFNDLFNISRDKKIILHAGGVYGAFYGVKELFDYLDEWPDDYVLVIHTKSKASESGGFNIPVSLLNKKIYFNDKPVPYDNINDIYSSCEVGIILHNPIGNSFDTNILYGDLSIGKLFQHLQMGKPLVVRELPGYDKLIEGNHIGVCVKHVSEVLPALRKIFLDYENYQSSCLKFFEKMRFESHHKKISGLIEEMLK